MSKYTTVSITVEMAQVLDKIAENDPGYSNRSQVAQDAIRQFVKTYPVKIALDMKGVNKLG